MTVISAGAAEPALKISGVGVWSGQLRWGDPAEIPATAAELEELGYSSLWIPDLGGDVFGAVERLLRATESLIVATGVLNLWKHPASETAFQYARLVETYGDRVLVGIGVSHRPLIDADEPGRYRRPLAAMTKYLDELDDEKTPLPSNRRVLAALGPKMVDLAAKRSAGVHPYNATPDHTATVRRALGPDALVVPEQRVVLASSPEHGRAIGRAYLKRYFGMPNYIANWRRLGFTDADFEAEGSDQLVDRLVPWGAEMTVAKHIRAHLSAGANAVCVQIVSDGKSFPRDQWRSLAGVLF